MTGIVRKRSANRYDEARQLGIAAGFLKQKGDFRADLAEVLDVLEPAIWHGQVIYFQDAYGSLCGMAFYAGLSDRIERSMLGSGSLSLHNTDWNEGERYWVIALAVNGRGIRAMLEPLRAEMAKVTEVVYFRRARPGRATVAWAVHTKGALRPRRICPSR